MLLKVVISQYLYFYFYSKSLISITIHWYISQEYYCWIVSDWTRWEGISCVIHISKYINIYLRRMNFKIFEESQLLCWYRGLLLASSFVIDITRYCWHRRMLLASRVTVDIRLTGCCWHRTLLLASRVIAVLSLASRIIADIVGCCWHRKSLWA